MAREGRTRSQFLQPIIHISLLHSALLLNQALPQPPLGTVCLCFHTDMVLGFHKGAESSILSALPRNSRYLHVKCAEPPAVPSAADGERACTWVGAPRFVDQKRRGLCLPSLTRTQSLLMACCPARTIWPLTLLEQGRFDELGSGKC